MFAASGIFGNILGGNFASTTTPSVGASGAIRKFYFVMIKLVIEERKNINKLTYSRTNSSWVSRFIIPLEIRETIC